MSTTSEEYQDFDSEHTGDAEEESPNNEIKRNFSCKICFEQYTKNERCPITLNCGHTFCALCIKSLCQNRRTIQCGICRKNTYSNYRKLGKNIDLIELMEWNNLLVNDENKEAELDELEEEAQQQWQGANHFIGRSELEEFYEDLNLSEGLVRQTLPYSVSRSRLERQINRARNDMNAVEVQLNSAGDAYRRVMSETETLRDQVINEITQRNEEAALTNFPYNNEPLGRTSSPDIIIRISPSDSEEDGNFYDRPPTTSQNNGRGRRNRNNNNNRNRRIRPRRQRLQIEFQYQNQRQTYQQGLQNVQDDDWGSSSGWGSNNDEQSKNGQSGEKRGDNEDEQPPQMQQMPLAQEQEVQQNDPSNEWWESSSGWGSDNEEQTKIEQPKKKPNHENGQRSKMPSWVIP